MRLNFTPWAMHTQYFAGKEQGIYAKEGLDVEIRSASAGQQNEVFIASGREHFGVANADSFIKARASGLPVVAIMADQPDTPFSVITLKKANITRPEQLKGKKLSWFQANVKGLLDPLLHEGGLTRDDIEYVAVARGAEVQMLAAGQVDAIFGYYYGQALTLELRGFPTSVMPLRDHGVKFYGSIIYTSESMLKNHPETVKKFVRATLKSLIWTRDNMDKAMSYIIAVSPDRDHALEVRKLKMIYDIYASPDYEERFGTMNDAKWQSSIDTLASSGDLQRKPAPKELYTNAILQGLEESRQLSTLVRTSKASKPAQ